MQDRNEFITRISRDIRRVQQVLAKDMAGDRQHVPPVQKEVLFIVAAYDGIHLKDIANALQVTPGAATQLVAALEKSGLLIREPDEKNKRAIRIFLSPEGRKTKNRLVRARAAIIEQLFADLTDEEIESLQNMLGKMSQTAKSELI